MVTTQEAIERMKEDYGASGVPAKVSNDAIQDNTTSVMNKIWQLVITERRRQIIKWGKRTHTDGIWLLILTEELGEASEALLTEDHLSGAEELVQAIAVIIAWIEDMLEKAERKA